MRLIARTVAAVVAIILGFALVGAAAFTPGSGSPVASRPTAPPIEPTVGSIQPLDPSSGGDADDDLPSAAPRPTPTVNIFSGEFGKRGKHVVTIYATGGAYKVSWRDGKSETTRGTLRSTRTLVGGFPLVQVGVFQPNGTASCTVTIDGVEKDHQTTDRQNPIVICQA